MLLGEDAAVDGVAGLVGAFGYGVASALVPVLNAEALVAVMGGTSRHWVAGVIALSLGTTAGKLAIMLGARHGAGWFEAWETGRGSTGTARRRDRPAGPWTVRRRRWGEAMLGQLDRPLVSGLVVLASAMVGIPPLALVAVLAGVRRTPVFLFAVAVLVGRLARFLAVAAPFAAATT